MKVGDVVYYKRDWKGKRPWYLFSLSQGDLCTIILLRDGKITNKKGNEERFNSSIVNLDINEIELL
jgi:hypothetical protein